MGDGSKRRIGLWDVNCGNSCNQGTEILESVARSLLSMNEHVIANVYLD